MKKIVCKEEVCETFVWILINSYKSTKGNITGNTANISSPLCR